MDSANDAFEKLRQQDAKEAHQKHPEKQRRLSIGKDKPAGRNGTRKQGSFKDNGRSGSRGAPPPARRGRSEATLGRMLSSPQLSSDGSDGEAGPRLKRKGDKLVEERRGRAPAKAPSRSPSKDKLSA